jgi:hypothetical protein
MTMIAEVFQHPPEALMQLLPAGWMKGNLGRSSFGQGWLESPIAGETKLENRNSKLGSR